MANNFYPSIKQLLSFSKKRKIFATLLLLASVSITSFGQAAFCNDADELCPANGVSYPATTNALPAEFGNDYGCLFTQPNPAWFYIEMEVGGFIDIALSNSSNVDIDFALWGPFTSLGNALATCGSLGAPTDCSYSPSSTETVNIPTSTAGQVYLLLITNFSNQPTSISGVATGTGVASCDGACLAEGGSLDSPPLTVCEDDAALSLPPNNAATHPDYSYTYVISQGGSVVAIDDTPDMSVVGPGMYSVCGFSYLTDDGGNLPGFIGQPLSSLQGQFAGSMDPFCGDFSDDCVDVTVGMMLDPIFIDTTLCAGDCFIVEGMNVCNSTSFTIMTSSGCDQDYNITVESVQPITTDVTEEVCPGECATVDGMQYCVGSHQIEYTNYQGCDSTVFLEVLEIVTIATISPNPPPPLDCNNPTVVLGASASDPTGGPFEWNGPNGFTSNSSSIIVSEPGTYTLTVFNNDGSPPCEATESVDVILDPNSPDIEVSEDPMICDGESVNLADYVFDVNGNNSATLTYHDDTPANAGNQIPSSVVMPTTTTTYYILATDGNCTDEVPITVIVNPAPTADFIADSPICLTDASIVTYTGNASPNANYLWDFSAAFADPGFGQGPNSLTFPAPGTFTISLVVEENGCPSQEHSVVIEVDEPLDPPMIQCQVVTTNSIQFFWPPIAGATSYDVTVDTGQPGSMNGSTTFLVENLMPNEDVTITVTAIGDGTCGNSVNTFTCTTQPCPDVILDITPVDDICVGGNLAPFDLNVNISGGSNNGQGTWIGDAIIDAINGTVDPSAIVLGDNVITFEYSEGDCDYSADITIQGVEAPTADFTATSPLCLTGSSTVEYAGTASSNANYIWNFDGGTGSPGNGVGPHTVTWNSGGTKTISLTVEENGCFSDPFEVMVEVFEQLQPPVINCTPTTNSIEFTWADVIGADSYTVTVLTGPTGMMTGTNSYEVTGLDPLEEVTILVEAIGNEPCPPSSETLTCFAQDCEEVNVTIDDVADICLDGTQSIINLFADSDDPTPTGTFEFSGSSAVSPTGAFDPDQAMIGANTVNVVYTEGTCTYNGSTTINVYEQPTADFTMDSPICETTAALINYSGNASSNAVYTWDFGGGNADPGTGSGPHQVTWDAPGTYTVTLMVSENGCDSEIETQMIEVQEALENLVINCSSTINSVTFTWNSISGASGYNVTDVTGPAGVMDNDTTYTVSGLNPGDMVTINVEAISAGLCANVSSNGDCTAQDCDPILVTVDPVDPICLDGNAMSFDLVASSDDATPTGTFTFSGSPAVTATGTFDPSLGMAGTNTVTVTYDEGDCSYTGSIDIILNEAPTADFTASSPICESDASTVMYTGTGGTGATYTWNFDGGTADPGTGQGPHQVTWATPGTYNISLTVEENGCASTEVVQMVQVDPTLPDFVVSCDPTINSVTFTWPDIAGASGYTVTDVTGPAGMMVNDTTYTVTGLSPGDMVEITVEAISAGACPNVTVSGTCTAQNCDPIIVTIDPVADICLDATTMPFDLVVTTDDATPTGTLTFSGSPAVNATGTFDPSAATLGLNTVNVEYAEGTCTYNGTIDIIVNETPTSDFTADSPICVTGTSMVTYAGSAGTGATYTWDFDGGNADPGTGQGPHTVDWSTAGTYNITLTVEENGCTSTMTTQMVQVDAELIAPIISCNATTNSVEFVWDAVIGATGYTVNSISGQMGTPTSDTSFIFENLGTDETVNIEIVIEGTTVCGNITVPASCTTTDCAPATIAIINPSPICLDGNTGPITLDFTTDINNPDSICWTGSCIPNPKDPIFDPNMGGAGMNQVTVTIVDGDCVYTESIIIEVIAPPTADFTASSPICIDATSTVTYTGTAAPGSTFAWDFGGGTASPGNGEGPHEVSWGTSGPQTISLIVTDNNGCASEEFMVDVQVDDILPMPVVNCNSTTTSVEFFWDPVLGATDYVVDVLTGEMGTMTSDTSFEIINLPVGTVVEITVTANGNTACGSSVTMAECTALDCPTVIIDITPVDDICLEGFSVPSSLEVMVSGNPNCVGEWSGQGIIDMENGVFDPMVAGIGAHVITYTCTDGPCVTSQTTTINVFAVPVADFTFTSPICEDDASTIEFSGMASANATYTWNFGGGIANPGGNNPGPHLVTWAGSGPQTVTLTVEDNGCTSETVAYEIEVVNPLIPPVIDCNTTTESIEFIWNTVAGAAGYNVTVTAGQTGTQTSDTTYLVTGLNPLDMVSITLEIVDDGPCDNITLMTSCTAVDCPDVTIDLVPIGPYCFGGLLEQEILDVTVNGGAGNGTGTWSGDGIVNPNDNVFDPLVAGIGTHQLVYTYTEGNCSYNEAIVVEIVAAPNADAGLAMTLTCDEPDNIAQLGGPGTSVGANIVYDWSTNTGNPFPGDSTIANPTVIVPGIYTLTVTNTLLDCSAVSTVSVDANQAIPTPFINISDATCFGDGDGFIAVDTVENGTPPYLYSFNGGPLSSTSFFPNLEAGEYTLLIEDANGCSQELSFGVGQPDELNINLNSNIEGDDQIVELGDGVILTIQSSIPFEELDSVQWLPPLSVECDTCQTNTIFPTGPMTFSVMVQEGDCVATDDITIFVSKDLDIHVPNVFSPNGDGDNDYVIPFANEDAVLIINSFLIFNRWGEEVYTIYNIPPNDIAFGWNGTQRGKPLDPQVFVWFAEVVFVDGTTKIFKGDVTLVK